MSLYEGIKDVASIVQKADNIELYQKVINLQKEALDLIEENMLLKDRIRRLEEKRLIKDNLVFKDNCYYLKTENDTFDGPFCSTCWDKDNKLIRMRNTIQHNPNFYLCNVCNSNVDIISKW